MPCTKSDIFWNFSKRYNFIQVFIVFYFKIPLYQESQNWVVRILPKNIWNACNWVRLGFNIWLINCRHTDIYPILDDITIQFYVNISWDWTHFCDYFDFDVRHVILISLHACWWLSNMRSAVVFTFFSARQRQTSHKNKINLTHAIVL